jgi:hypothetical protein
MDSTQYGVYDHTAEDGTVHVFPMFGPGHYCTESCWCHPEPDASAPAVIVHNVAH